MHRGNGKPRVHARDHEHGGADTTLIHYEDVGGGGSTPDTLAILYDTFPQNGGYIAADTDGGGISFRNLDTGDNNPVSLTNQDDGGIQLQDEGEGGINIQSSHGGLIFVQQSGTGDIEIGAGSGDVTISTSSGLIILSGLPTSDPAHTGALWNDAGTLKIS